MIKHFMRILQGYLCLGVNLEKANLLQFEIQHALNTQEKILITDFDFNKIKITTSDSNIKKIKSLLENIEIIFETDESNILLSNSQFHKLLETYPSLDGNDKTNNFLLKELGDDRLEHFPLTLDIDDHMAQLQEFSVKKTKDLAEVQELYQKGLQHFKEHNYELAEKEFTKVLKPTLSKSSKQSLYIKIEDYKKELLDSLYHLGKIYLASNHYHENYAKAIAIFQYCNVFVQVYGVKLYKPIEFPSIIKLSDNVREEVDFLEQAWLAQEQFLAGTHAEGECKNAQYKEEYTQYKERINQYKIELEKIRKIVEVKLEEIGRLKIDRIDKRAEAIKDLYKDCNKFFINNDRNNEEELGLIQKLLYSCFERLGYPPKECEYSIIGVGSVGGGKMTPWSDLDFAILVNEDVPKYKEYFRNLTKLLHIKIINLGETPLRSLGIEALNNFKTANIEDDWFWDTLITPGFSFDGPNWHACKSPLGRQGNYRAAIKKKNNSGIENLVIEEKPDYELILTPAQLAEFQKDAKRWHNSDEQLVQALRSVMLIEGSQSLLNSYRKEVSKAEDPEKIKSRALDILKQDVDSFSLKLGEAEEGKLMVVKKSIYRVGDRIIDALANYYSITAKEGQIGLTVWEVIDEMERDIENEQVLSSAGAQHLREALSIATELRLTTYSFNKGQSEDIATYIPVAEHLGEEEKKKLLEKTFYIKDTSILHHFYYVMLRVQEIIQGFCNKKWHKSAEMFLRSDNLFDDSNYSKGMTYARFLEYDKALKYMEAAKTEHPENYEILYDLFLLYSKTGRTENAVVLAQGILKLKETSYQDDPNLGIIAIYNNLGSAYSDEGKYDQAIQYYKQSLNISLIDYKNNPNHLIIANSYNNLGNAYNYKGEYNKAIHYYNYSLMIKLINYNTVDGYLTIAKTYNGLGDAYTHQGNYKQAAKYYQQALKLRLKSYINNPNHPEIANIYNKLGIIYNEEGKYDHAIEYYQLALNMMFKVYRSIPNHPDLATIYNGLSVAHIKKKNDEQAMQYSQLALGIMHQAYNDNSNHFDIAIVYDNLGTSYSVKGDYRQAIEYYQEALRIKFIAYNNDSNHPAFVTSYNNLGNVYFLKDDYVQALNYFNQALEIMDQAYEGNFNYQSKAVCYNNLGNINYFIGKYKQAYYYAQKALNITSLFQDYSYINLIRDLYNRCLVQLGNLSLLNSDDEEAKKFYSALDSIYKQVDFHSEEFIKLQLQHASFAYNYNDLSSALNCLRILIKVDPEFKYGNHYYILARLYAVQNNIYEARDAFLKALTQSDVEDGLHMEYAQFLIVNKGSMNFNVNTQDITKHLYETINSENLVKLHYSEIEKDIVCNILKVLLKERNTPIIVSPKVLAYYLLIKHPEFIASDDSIGNLLNSFRKYCNTLQDEVSARLLEDCALSYYRSMVPEEANEFEALAILTSESKKLEQNSNIIIEDLKLRTSSEISIVLHIASDIEYDNYEIG